MIELIRDSASEMLSPMADFTRECRRRSQQVVEAIAVREHPHDLMHRNASPRDTSLPVADVRSCGTFLSHRRAWDWESANSTPLSGRATRPYFCSTDMARELTKHGVKHELLTIEGAEHGLRATAIPRKSPKPTCEHWNSFASSWLGSESNTACIAMSLQNHGSVEHIRRGYSSRVLTLSVLSFFGWLLPDQTVTSDFPASTFMERPSFLTVILPPSSLAIIEARFVVFE